MSGEVDATGHGQFVLRTADPELPGDGDELWWDEDGTGVAEAVLLAYLPAASSLAALDIAISF